MIITAVAGNPKPASRTLAAAALVAARIAGAEPDEVIDVIGLGPGLLSWGDEVVVSAAARVAASDLVVIASPTFKGTYTGVLKLFLDQFATATGLRGVTAVPLMLGAGSAHALAPELLLKPVLVELGATVATQELYLSDSSFDQESATEPWLQQWREVVLASAGGPDH